MKGTNSGEGRAVPDIFRLESGGVLTLAADETIEMSDCALRFKAQAT